MCYKAGVFLLIVCSAKPFSMLVEKNHLVQFQYTDFLILINSYPPSAAYTRQWTNSA